MWPKKSERRILSRSLITRRVLELAVPGRLNSRNQKYRLTPKGMSLAKSLDEKS